MVEGPAKIEVFVNGQPIGQPFEATELNVTESKTQLILQARRKGLPYADGLNVTTCTPLDGYFGDLTGLMGDPK